LEFFLHFVHCVFSYIIFKYDVQNFLIMPSLHQFWSLRMIELYVDFLNELLPSAPLCYLGNKLLEAFAESDV